MSTLSNLPQSKTRTEYSHSPICIFNKDNKTSNPTMMNIRMNFDLLNHKIERLNNMMINTSSNDYDTFDLKSNDSFRTFEKRNNKNPNYLNSVTTTVTNDNSPFKNSYSQRKEFSPSIDNLRHHLGCGGLRFFDRFGDDDALAERKTGGLHDDRGGLRVEISERGVNFCCKRINRRRR